MAKLAIKYEEGRKNEIIDFLTNIGGKYCILTHFQDGDYCYIDVSNQICSIKGWNTRLKKDFCKFTFQDLKNKFPYQIKDRVILNKLLRLGDDRCDMGTVNDMFWDGQIQEIRYIIKFDTGMISGDYSINDLEPITEEVTTNDNEQSSKIVSVNFQDRDYSDEVELCLNNSYEILERDGKWFAVKKELIFPKTFDECSNIVDIKSERYLKPGNGKNNSELFFEEKIKQFRELVICRNAYWSLLGNWKQTSKDYVYSIARSDDGIGKFDLHTGNVCLLEFPTRESRDIFFENFKDLIESCKEFL